MGNLLGNHKCIIMNNDLLFILNHRCTYSEIMRNQSSCNVVLYASIAYLALHTADPLSVFSVAEETEKGIQEDDHDW